MMKRGLPWGVLNDCKGRAAATDCFEQAWNHKRKREGEGLALPSPSPPTGPPPLCLWAKHSTRRKTTWRRRGRVRGSSQENVGRCYKRIAWPRIENESQRHAGSSLTRSCERAGRWFTFWGERGHAIRAWF